jgi:hypothetical protein
VVRQAFPSWMRSIVTEIYLCRACSCHEILRVETPRTAAAAAAAALAARVDGTIARAAQALEAVFGLCEELAPPMPAGGGGGGGGGPAASSSPPSPSAAAAAAGSWGGGAEQASLARHRRALDELLGGLGERIRAQRQQQLPPPTGQRRRRQQLWTGLAPPADSAASAELARSVTASFEDASASCDTSSDGPAVQTLLETYSDAIVQLVTQKLSA